MWRVISFMIWNRFFVLQTRLQEVQEALSVKWDPEHSFSISSLEKSVWSFLFIDLSDCLEMEKPLDRQLHMPEEMFHIATVYISHVHLVNRPQNFVPAATLAGNSLGYNADVSNDSNPASAPVRS